MKPKILLTGATGYVGGKLLKRLEREGYEVNCLVRTRGKLASTGIRTTVFEGDTLVRSSMWKAFQGVETAYYLVHSLYDETGFESRDLESAENFASMARGTGVKRIIYLGALGNARNGLSPHLQSRQDVGHVLRHCGIPALELRASIVLGEGSLSFNMIRDLAEHLPVMLLPKWVRTQAQPIGIKDLLEYLLQAITVSLPRGRIVEIGGADRLSYGDLMREYARQRGLKRLMVPVPVLSPWLSSHWLAFFTEVDARLGRKLIEGIKSPTVVENPDAAQLFHVRTQSAASAMREAIREIEFHENDQLEELFAALQPARRHGAASVEK